MIFTLINAALADHNQFQKNPRKAANLAHLSPDNHMADSLEKQKVTHSAYSI